MKRWLVVGLLALNVGCDSYSPFPTPTPFLAGEVRTMSNGVRVRLDPRTCLEVGENGESVPTHYDDESMKWYSECIHARTERDKLTHPETLRPR